eukprot:290963-Chlamydomonas_euryale.AAC.1
MLEAGETAMAGEYRALFGLPEASVRPPDPSVLAAEAAERAARFLQPPHPPHRRLLLDDPSQMPAATALLARAPLIGIDVEWKPSWLGGGGGVSASGGGGGESNASDSGGGGGSVVGRGGGGGSPASLLQ